MGDRCISDCEDEFLWLPLVRTAMLLEESCEKSEYANRWCESVMIDKTFNCSVLNSLKFIYFILRNQGCPYYETVSTKDKP